MSLSIDMKESRCTGANKFEFKQAENIRRKWLDTIESSINK